MRIPELYIKENEKILIVSPHPDDESIGVGGLLSLFPKQCEIIVMTDGRYGNADYAPDEMINIRKKEFISAMDCVGVSVYQFFAYEDGTLLQNKKCFSRIDFSCYSYVFVPNPHDNHGDHTACCEYVIDSLRKRGRHGIRVFQYEVHTPLADVNCCIDIGKVINRKKEMIKCFASQLKTHPYEEQIIALSAYRGYQNEQPGKYLETYQEVYLNDHISGVTGTEIELTKYKQFTKVLSQWIYFKNRKITLFDFLKQNNLNEVAIYGYGILGKILLDEFVQKKIKVKYIIDKNENVQVDNFVVYHKIENLEKVDAVIITLLNDCDEISRELEQKCGLKSIVLKNVFEELKV